MLMLYFLLVDQLRKKYAVFIIGFLVGLRDTEIFYHDKYRQNVSRYSIYRDTSKPCS
jgi:hypothetical protein